MTTVPTLYLLDDHGEAIAAEYFCSATCRTLSIRLDHAGEHVEALNEPVEGLSACAGHVCDRCGVALEAFK